MGMLDFDFLDDVRRMNKRQVEVYFEVLVNECWSNALKLVDTSKRYFQEHIRMFVSESDYFTGDTSIDIHSPGLTIAHVM